MLFKLHFNLAFCSSVKIFEVCKSSRRFSKYVLSEILQYSQESTYVGVSFNKVATLKSCNFIKNRLQTQVFSCENCKIFKNSFFYRTHQVAAFESIIDAKRYRKTSIGFVLVSLLLTLNIFHSSFYCMHSSLWAGKRRLRSELGCFLPAKKSYLSKNKN